MIPNTEPEHEAESTCCGLSENHGRVTRTSLVMRAVLFGLAMTVLINMAGYLLLYTHVDSHWGKLLATEEEDDENDHSFMWECYQRDDGTVNCFMWRSTTMEQGYQRDPEEPRLLEESKKAYQSGRPAQVTGYNAWFIRFPWKAVMVYRNQCSLIEGFYGGPPPAIGDFSRVRFGHVLWIGLFLNLTAYTLAYFPLAMGVAFGRRCLSNRAG